MKEQFAEKEVAKRLGVTQVFLREMRKDLKPGAHYAKKGRGFQYTEAGLKALLEKYDLNDLPESSDASGKRPGKAGGKRQGPVPAIFRVPALALVEMTVKGIVRNPNIVLAIDSEGKPTRVRVKDNRNFLPGMKFWTKHLSGDLYELNGRCPRYRGKW